MSNRERIAEDEEREAQAALDQVRAQAGGALSGQEVAKRHGFDPDDVVGDPPPLDWRMTPRNILLQLVAVAVFIGVVWFFVTLVVDSLSLLFG